MQVLKFQKNTYVEATLKHIQTSAGNGFVKSDGSKAAVLTSASLTTVSFKAVAIRVITGPCSTLSIKGHWKELSGHMSSSPDSNKGAGQVTPSFPEVDSWELNPNTAQHLSSDLILGTHIMPNFEILFSISTS